MPRAKRPKEARYFHFTAEEISPDNPHMRRGIVDFSGKNHVEKFHLLEALRHARGKKTVISGELSASQFYAKSPKGEIRPEFTKYAEEVIDAAMSKLADNGSLRLLLDPVFNQVIRNIALKKFGQGNFSIVKQEPKGGAGRFERMHAEKGIPLFEFHILKRPAKK